MKKLNDETKDLIFELLQKQYPKKDIEIICKISHETVRKYSLGRLPTGKPKKVITINEKYDAAIKNQEEIERLFQTLNVGIYVKIYSSQYRFDKKFGIIICGLIAQKDNNKIVVDRKMFTKNDFICKNAKLLTN